MHVIEGEVGPFSEIGLKSKGEDTEKPTYIHIEKTFLIIVVKRNHDHL